MFIVKNVVCDQIAFLIALFTRIDTLIHSDDQSEVVNTSSPKPASTIREYALGTYYFLHFFEPSRSTTR